MAPGTKVFIGNLPDEVDEDALRGYFASVGKIAEFDIIKNYGFVHYESADDAKKAVADLNETDWEGFKLKVEASRSSVRQKPGMGGNKNCYSCEEDGHWGRGRGRGRGFRGGRGAGGRGGRGRGYEDPYADPYGDYYARRPRYPPPMPGYDRFAPYADPYERRRMALARDPYLLERERDYYDQLAARDAAYYDFYARRRAAAYADREGYAPPRNGPATRPPY